ncbi:ATP-grasp domain-containing protein [Amylibacter sp.]|nr:ATP-grasp domain-containing protein [Amylibacter sp.]
MTDKHNILILSAGRRVELIKLFQATLVQYFPNASVITTDFNPKLSPACHVANTSFTAPKVTSPNYIDFLLNLCTQENIGMVIPTIDTELKVLSERRADFDEKNINLIISEKELVDACHDKRKTSEVFFELDIDQPLIYSIDEIELPCFCKPYDGSSSQGAFPIYSRDQLSTKYIEDKNNMFMELINESYKEYTIDAYYDRESYLKCLVPRERLEVRSGEISKGITRKDFVYYYLIERLKVFKGARGCLTIQVFANEKICSIKAIEINPRFGGGYPLAYAAGANYADWLIREYFLGEDLRLFTNWENNLLMLRYDANVIVHEN